MQARHRVGVRREEEPPITSVFTYFIAFWLFCFPPPPSLPLSVCLSLCLSVFSILFSIVSFFLTHSHSLFTVHIFVFLSVCCSDRWPPNHLEKSHPTPPPPWTECISQSLHPLPKVRRHAEGEVIAPVHTHAHSLTHTLSNLLLLSLFFLSCSLPLALPLLPAVSLSIPRHLPFNPLSMLAT